jgi:hypothetical protein
MENEEKKSRQRIKVDMPLDDALELYAFSVRHPVYGITLRFLQNDAKANTCSIEMLFRSQSKSSANQSLIHFFLGYAREQHLNHLKKSAK